MKPVKKFLLITILGFLSTCLFGQEKYALVLEISKDIPSENLKDFIQDPNIQDEEIINGKYYRMVQFFDLPSMADHQRIAASGIELLEYFPKLTYLTAIPKDISLSELENFNIRAVFPLDLSLKISPKLEFNKLPEWAIASNQIKVMLQYHKNISATQATKKMLDAELTIIKSNGINNFFETRIKPENLAQVASLPFVAHLGLGPAPDIKDDVKGRSLHRSNVLDSGLPLGRNYDGTGVNVLVRDDGKIGPHIDFHGRLTQDLAELDFLIDTHGDNVAGIMSGAGNFDPTKRGMAAGTGIYVLEYDATFLDHTMDYFFNDNVIVTNSSYSNGCNDGYTATTATVDQQVFQNPTLMHVFSAGNSNNNSCGYGAGSQWGNITGGHKQGKNVTTVANLIDDGSLVNTSSRGPAHDGRIKPDIASYGEGQFGTEPNNSYDEFSGTSAAAPGVAGIFAQLQQAYKTLNGDQVATSALLKGILLNTANDLGNEGPDFQYGWGHINAFRAVKVMEENRYQQLEVAPGETTEFSINIPDNVKKAKIMLYWNDPEAAIGTGFALVNDLDLKLQKDGIDYLPWVLDASPNAITLGQPATKGEDHLNNIEQVSIDHPASGAYTVIVNGTVLPFGIKDFYMIYEYQTEAVDITYPIGGETMVPGTHQNIHWDAVGQLEDYELSYSIDGGTTWEAIASVAGSERLYTDWVVPNTTTPNGKIRISCSNGNETINEIDFNIAPMPENVAIATACPEGITLVWDAIPGAMSYDVYVLGEKYMEVIGNVAENSFLFSTNNLELEQYFSVHAVFGNGAISRRVNAICFTGGLKNCSQPNDLSNISTSIDTDNIFLSCDGISEEIFSLEITNNGLTVENNFFVSYQINNQPIVTDQVNFEIQPGGSYSHDFSQPINFTEEGIYNLKSWITLSENSYALDDTINQVINLSIYENEGALLGYHEAFEEEIFPPTDFLIVNPDNAISWKSRIVVQRDGSVGQVAWVDNFNYASAANENIADGLLTTLIDLSDATDEVLSFDLAYREYQPGGFTIEDGFRVAVSTDCGNTYDEVLYEAFGNELATLEPSTTSFFPSNQTDWEKITLDIAAYYGQSVIFKFENLSGYGNNLFLDNIKVDFLASVAPVAQFDANSETICQGETIIFTSTSEGAENHVWSFGNSTEPSSATTSGPHTVTFLTAGTNVVELVVSNELGTDIFEMEVFIEELAVADFESEIVEGTLMVDFTNTSEGGQIFEWDFGDGNVSLEENPTHIYSGIGTYEVSLRVGSPNCPFSEMLQTISLLSTSTADLGDRFSLNILPNPNDGQFRLQVIGNSTEVFDWKLTGVDGKSYLNGKINTSRMEEINATGVAPGLYFLELTSNGQRLIERVMVMN